jgi:mRNA-degrading endonuclease RelE of RelBE toxin-antitoxin system
MEPRAQSEAVDPRAFRVLWHPDTRRDLARIPPATVEAVATAARERLSQAPLLIGEPLRGTTQRLWRLRYSQYRVISTVRPATHEVWILSVQTRDIVYRTTHLQRLLRLALQLRQPSDESQDPLTGCDQLALWRRKRIAQTADRCRIRSVNAGSAEAKHAAVAKGRGVTKRAALPPFKRESYHDIRPALSASSVSLEQAS